ncbi:MAG: Spy/CpxP family protein refolding chaperone [Thermoguttaceae bacterium]
MQILRIWLVFFFGLFLATPLVAQDYDYEMEMTLPTIESLIIANSQGKLSFVRITNDMTIFKSGVFQNYLGLTDEQLEKFNNVGEKANIMFESLDDITPEAYQNFSEDEKAATREQIMTTFDTAVKMSDDTYNETLTPEQIQKMRELELIIPEDMFGDDFPFPMPNFDAYLALDLTDEQIAELDTMRDAAEAEFKQQFGEVVDSFRELAKTAESIENPENPEKPSPELVALIEKMSEQTAEQAKLNKEKNVKIHSNVKGILTPEQLEKLAKLEIEVKNRFESIQKKLQAKNDAEKEASSDDTAKSEEWRPDENSWKPGDPLPENMKVEPKKGGRFPGLK